MSANEMLSYANADRPAMGSRMLRAATLGIVVVGSADIAAKLWTRGASVHSSISRAQILRGWGVRDLFATIYFGDYARLVMLSRLAFTGLAALVTLCAVIGSIQRRRSSHLRTADGRIPLLLAWIAVAGSLFVPVHLWSYLHHPM